MDGWPTREGLAVRVGDVAEAGEGVAEPGRGLLAQVRGPFGFDGGLGLPGGLDRGLATLGDLHQPGPGVADRVWPNLFPWRAERKLGGFRFAATDCSWSAGDGLLVEGPIAAILLLLTGRRAALAQLSGPGARELSAVGLDQQAAQDLA